MTSDAAFAPPASVLTTSSLVTNERLSGENTVLFTCRFTGFGARREMSFGSAAAAPDQSSSDSSPPDCTTVWKVPKKSVCADSASVPPSLFGLNVAASITPGFVTSRSQPARPSATAPATATRRTVRAVRVLFDMEWSPQNWTLMRAVQRRVGGSVKSSTL